MRRASLLVALALALGCEADQGSPQASSSAAPQGSAAASAARGTSEEQWLRSAQVAGATAWCASVFSAPVERITAACSAEERMAVETVWLEQFGKLGASRCQQLLERGAREGRTVFYGPARERCAKALAELRPDWGWLSRARLAGIDACRGVVKGLQGDGAPCRAGIECQSGLVCVGAGPASDGACGAAPRLGDSCLSDSLSELLGGSDPCGSDASCTTTPFGATAASRAAERVAADRASLAAQLGVSGLRAEGPLPPELLARLLGTAQPRLAWCASQAPSVAAAPEGETLVRLRISGAGTVVDAQLAGSLLDEPALGRCALGALAELAFPPRPEGVTLVVAVLQRKPAPTDAAASAETAAVSETAAPPSTSGPSSSASPVRPVSPRQAATMCFARRAAGAACQRRDDCRSPLHCRDGVCSPEPAGPSAPTDSCLRDADCALGSYCAAAASDAPKRGAASLGRCQRLEPAGAACQGSRQCRGRCVAQRCASLCGSG